jgi:DNA-binding IclR family transcriptional regulator
LAKAFEILDMFSLATPLLNIDEISAAAGYTRSTTYRYLKELCDAGLLAPAAGAMYGLGPRIIELERLLVLTDPLYTAGSAVLRDLGQGDKVLLLHNLYRDKVLCIYKEGPDTLMLQGKRVVVRRARGLPFPLFQGAASLALLAYLSPHRVRQTYLRSATEIAQASLGQSWKEFRGTLSAIRRRGYATSQGTITPYLGGVAVPVLLPDKRVVGSLAHTIPADVMDEAFVEQSARDLWIASERIAVEYVKASKERGA